MINAKTWNPAQIDQAIRRLEGIIRSGSYNPAELNQLLNQLGEPGYINTWNPAELDQKLRTLLHDLLSWKTTTGNPIQLRTNNGGLVQSCEVTFSPIQSGSGDPSPTNIRPISGRDSLHLYQDTEQTETPETTHTATFPDTVYGGKLDFVSGKLKIEWFKYVVDSYSKLDDANTVFGNNNVRISFAVPIGSQLPPMMPHVTTDDSKYIKCNLLNVLNYSVWGTYDSRTGISSIQQYWRSFACSIPKSIVGNTKESLGTYLENNPLEVTYYTDTPIEITLTPEDIELLTGANVLWTDGDAIEITYKKLLLPSDVEELSKSKKIIEEKPKTKRSKKKKEE